LNRDGKSFQHYRVSKKNKNGPISDNVLQIMEDDEGYIWLATHGGGISKLDKNTGNFTNFIHQTKNKNSLSGDAALSIYQDSRGRVWVGTQGRGLNRWEPEDRRQSKNNFKHYTVKDGLPSSTVNGVLEDEAGYIWISTNKGISRLDPEINKFKHYNLALEIHDNELNQGSMLRASDGQLFFGGLNGISAFYPEEIASNSYIPPVVLTNISSENKSINFDDSLTKLKQIKFSHQDYLITFEFAALDFSQPERNQYQYKLEGFDPDWISTGNLNRATYTNLPSGTYTFKVKGSNNNGLWSDESINLRVIIEPAPWASWWAFIIYATIFCISLIILIRSQAKRIANQELFQKKVAEKIDFKTALYEKDNLSLKEQIKNYQHNSGNDLATGLPNQSFFTEQLLISLDWLKNISKKSIKSEQKLCCIILKLTTERDEKIEERLAELADQITTQEESIHLVARWNENELAMLCFIESKKQASELVGRICKHSNSGQQEKNKQNNSKISLGYSLVPLHLNDPQSFMWENILMLTEHAMRSANKYDGNHYIGLLACHQKLSSVLIKDIMVSKDILKLKDMFDFDSNV
jgi:GGDEF domain-containing protein